ncbi:MAG: hypothetical protein NUV90_03255 [Candidatus Parcubacteria bacterium]|nr:hypothetical protein [Candidatus Parcubacteria bacterium]
MTVKKDVTEVELAREKVAKIALAKTAVNFIKTSGKDGERHLIGEFSFRIEKASSVLGGNTAEIWYRKRPVPVFKIWWQFDIENCKFEKFDPDQEWQQALLKFIEERVKAPVGAHRVVPVILTKYVAEQKERNRERKEKGLYDL